MKKRIVLLLFGVAVCFAAGHAAAKDAFYNLKVTELKAVRGALPVAGAQADHPWRAWDVTLFPRAFVDGGGEAYFHGNLSYWNWPAGLHESGMLAVRAPAGKKVTVRAFLPTTDLSAMQEVEFAISPANASKDARANFYQIKRDYYRSL